MIRVQGTPIDLAAELAGFGTGDTGIGGIATFVGRVRDRMNDGRRLVAMTLEHYPGMTERELEKIEDEARRRWPLAEVLVIHRFGRMVPGEPIVLVATAAGHRAEAFEACEFLMDWLKTKAPFWKFEETEDDASWVAAKESDDQAAARWAAKPE